MHQIRTALLALGIAGAAAAAEISVPAPSPSVQEPAHEARWTWTPPVIDGNPDDAVWGDVSQPLVLIGDARVKTARTTIRLLYDAEFLYLFMEMEDDDPASIRRGFPEDRRDLDFGSCDHMELFISTDGHSDRYFHLAFNAMGARFDEAHYPGYEGPASFDPEWQVVVAMNANGWVAEIRIPFMELALPGQYAATPQLDQAWRIGVIRNFTDRAVKPQVWPAAGSAKQDHAWPSGLLTFSGVPSQSGGMLPPIRVEPFADGGTLRLGNNRLRGQAVGVSRYAVTHNSKPVTLASRTFHDGRSDFYINQRTPLDGGSFSTPPIEIASEGQWKVALWFYLPGARQLLYRGTIATTIPSTSEIEDMLATGRSAHAILMHTGLDRVQTLVGHFARFNREAEDILEGFNPFPAQPDTEPAGDAGDWESLLSRYQALRHHWQSLSFEAMLAEVMAANRTNRDFGTVTVAADYRLFLQETVVPGWTNTVRLAAAGREYESFQIAILPFWQDVKDVSVSFSALQGKNGIITEDNVSGFRVEWVHNTLHRRDTLARPRPLEPDMLLPLSNLDVPAGELRAVWIDVYCPPGTPAGDYSGSVRIEASGQALEIPLVLHAYGFDLPPTSTLLNNHWTSVAQQAAFWGKPFTPEIHERQARVAARYRISYFADNTWLLHSPSHFAIWLEPDGSFSFDFSKWIPYIRTGLKYGGNFYSASGGCNTAVLNWIHPGFPVTERATGKSTTLRVLMPEFFTQGTPKLRWQTRVYRDYLGQLESFLREQGILNMSYYEMFDEAGHNLAEWRDMVEHHELMAEVAPELISMQYGPRPLAQQHGGVKPLGYCDAWAPNLGSALSGWFGPSGEDMWRSVLERRNLFGEKALIYTPGRALHPYLSAPRLRARLLPWVARKLDANGLLVYMLGGVQENPRRKDYAEYWPNTAWSDPADGLHNKMYMDADLNFIPSIRLANLRDGMEDYEYFTVLRKAGSYLDPDIPEQADLLQRILDEGAVEDEIYASPTEGWTHERSVLEAKRDRMASLIQEVQAIRRTRVESLNQQVGAGSGQ